MIARLAARVRAARESANTPPFTEQELAVLREVPAEGKALRRRRRKVRPQLLRGPGC